MRELHLPESNEFAFDNIDLTQRTFNEKTYPDNQHENTTIITEMKDTIQ